MPHGVHLSSVLLEGVEKSTDIACEMIHQAVFYLNDEILSKQRM